MYASHTLIKPLTNPSPAIIINKIYFDLYKEAYKHKLYDCNKED